MRCVIAAVNGEEGGAGVHEHDGGERYGLSVGPQRPGERGRVQQLGREVAGHEQCNVAG
jgi:hypothetical protein